MESIFSSVAQGVLELRVNNTFAQLWLAPRFQRFCTLHPKVAVRLYGVNWEVEEPTSATELEIRYGVGVWPDFEVTELLPRGLRPYCSKATSSALRGGGLPDLRSLTSSVLQWAGASGSHDMYTTDSHNKEST